MDLLQRNQEDSRLRREHAAMLEILALSFPGSGNLAELLRTAARVIDVNLYEEYKRTGKPLTSLVSPRLRTAADKIVDVLASIETARIEPVLPDGGGPFDAAVDRVIGVVDRHLGERDGNS